MVKFAVLVLQVSRTQRGIEDRCHVELSGPDVWQSERSKTMVPRESRIRFVCLSMGSRVGMTWTTSLSRNPHSKGTVSI